MFTRLCVLTSVLFFAVTPAFADPWKDESGKGRGEWKKWDEKRWKEAEKNREKERERAEKAWEKQRKEEEKYRDEQRRWSQNRQPGYWYENRYDHRYDRRHDDDWYDDDDRDSRDAPRYETRRPVYRDGYYYGEGESRPNRYHVPPTPRPYDEGRYYPGRGAAKGGRIGARIGELIGGPEGARIGAQIGAEIGEEVDR